MEFGCNFSFIQIYKFSYISKNFNVISDKLIPELNTSILEVDIILQDIAPTELNPKPQTVQYMICRLGSLLLYSFKSTVVVPLFRSGILASTYSM